MAAYLTNAYCEAALGDSFAELYELPADQAELEADIEAAEALVNGYVGKRYQTPVTNAAAVAFLKPLAAALFVERAWTLRGTGDEIPKKAATAADNARKTLEDIARGLVTLGGATALAEQAAGGAEAIVVAGNTPEFTRDQMQGF